MSNLVRVQHKGQMTIPSKVRSAIGLSDGDLVEVKAIGGKIVIIPQLVIDRSRFPVANGDYTRDQRRLIDARLAEAAKGPYFGPFKSGAEVAAFLKKKRRAAKSDKPRKSE